MKKGVILDWDCVGPDVDLVHLKSLPVDWTIHRNTPSHLIEERLNEQEIAVVGKVFLKREALSHAKKLRLICEMATGYDNIDVAAAKDLGITVSNVPAYSTDSVAQLTLFLMLSLLFSSPSYENTKQEWPRSSLFSLFKGPIHEAKNKTVGIIGAGQIGQEVGKLCRAFGMKTIFTASRDPKKSLPGALPLEQILPLADLVSLHLPLTTETRHLFDEKRIFSMKKGAFLINAARGALIEETALAKALKEHHLGGAALDVLSQEPPPSTHPLLDPSIPNLILTPHIGWASIEARKRLFEVIVKNIQAYLDGKPQNVIS